MTDCEKIEYYVYETVIIVHKMAFISFHSENLHNEAIRRIANKDSEKTIHETMRKLEYETLPKCHHGTVCEIKSWTEFQKKYNPAPYKYQTLQGIFKLPRCSTCHEERIREEVIVAAAAAIRRIAKIAVMERQIKELQTKIAQLRPMTI